MGLLYSILILLEIPNSVWTCSLHLDSMAWLSIIFYYSLNSSQNLNLLNTIENVNENLAAVYYSNLKYGCLTGNGSRKETTNAFVSNASIDFVLCIKGLDSRL